MDFPLCYSTSVYYLAEYWKLSVHLEQVVLHNFRSELEGDWKPDSIIEALEPLSLPKLDAAHRFDVLPTDQLFPTSHLETNPKKDDLVILAMKFVGQNYKLD